MIRLVDNDTRDSLDHILPSSIRPEDRKLLIQHYVYGYPFEEIARLIGKKPAAIHQRMARLRKQLSKKLRKAPPVSVSRLSPINWRGLITL